MKSKGKDLDVKSPAQNETTHSQGMLLGLSYAAQAVQRAHAPEEVYSTFGRELARLGYNTSVFVLTEDQTHLIIAYLSLTPGLQRAAEKMTGLLGRDYRFRLAPGGFYQRILDGGQTVYCAPFVEPIAEALPQAARPLAGQIAVLLRLDQAIFSPLLVGGQVFGLLTVSGSGLVEADVPAVTVFANQTAIALEKLRLYQVTRDWGDELEQRVEEQTATLRESERKFREAIAHLDEGYYSCTIDGVLVEHNLAFNRILGFEPGRDLIGLKLPDFWQNQNDRKEYLNELMSKGFVRNYLIHAIKTSGEKIVLICNAHLGKDEKDRPARIEGVFTDFTERMRMEEQLRFQADLLSNVNDAIVASDAQYRLTVWNASAAALYGWKAEEVLGRNGLEIVRTEWPGKEAEEMRRTITENGRWRGEVIQSRKDGTRFPVEVSTLVLRDENGQITGYVSVNRDFTERKLAEKSLHDRLAELDTLHKVSAALRVAQTHSEALPILLDETLAALNTDTGVIMLYHPEHNELREAIARGWFRQLKKSPMRPGQGIAGSVFTSGQTLVSVEFRKDPKANPMTRDQIPDGWGGVCVPIPAGNETVGVLFVSVLLPRQITPEQVRLLESLTEMAGAALHRMRLSEETVRQLDQLQALHRIDQAIAASMDLKMTLGILLENVTSQLKVDAAIIHLLDPIHHALEYAVEVGFRTKMLESTYLNMGKSFAESAVLERKLIHIPDLRDRNTDFLRSPIFSAEGFVTYYSIPLIAKGQVKGVLEVFHRSPQNGDSAWLNFFETLARQAAIAIDGAQLFDDLQQANIDLTIAYDRTIEGWSRALDLRDRETEGHTQRVTKITLRLAQAAGVGRADFVHIKRGALLHDIGKMGVPDNILFKPGQLTDDEWVIMRQHPQFAFDMLTPITYLRLALEIPYCHHEKWDGTGYPRGIKGEQIPLAARLFAVVDVWDALRSERPYREAWNEEKVLEYLKAGSGKHFDPMAVELFLKLINEQAFEHGQSVIKLRQTSDRV